MRRYSFPNQERVAGRPMTVDPNTGWQAWLSRNLFPIAFSRNGISEMEKWDGRAFPKRLVLGSHVDRLTAMSGRLPTGCFMTFDRRLLSNSVIRQRGFESLAP